MIAASSCAIALAAAVPVSSQPWPMQSQHAPAAAQPVYAAANYGDASTAWTGSPIADDCSTPVYVDYSANDCSGQPVPDCSGPAPVMIVPYNNAAYAAPSFSTNSTSPPCVPATGPPGIGIAPSPSPASVPLITMPLSTPILATPRERAWLRAEYLSWWTAGNEVPALVTTSPNGTPLADAGVLGQPGTRTLFGDESLFDQWRSGVRADGGFWLPSAPDWGVELSYVWLEDLKPSYSASSTGDPILARPYFNVLTGVEDARPVAFPGQVAGGITIHSSSQFQTGEALIRRRISDRRDVRMFGFGPFQQRIDFVLGYRFALLDEDLRISESLATAGPTSSAITDSFDTKNEFHGVDVGFVDVKQHDRWWLELVVKLGLGSSRSDVRLSGQTATTSGGVTSTDAGGLLVLTTNQGNYVENDLAMIPELGLTLGYMITPNLHATLGYTFIYWSRVARPGDQIDRNVNPSYIPNGGPPSGAPQPEFRFVTSDFWAQGVSAGLELRF